MSDRTCLLDTNVIIYLYSNDEHDKNLIADALINEQNIVITRQVVNEICNVLIRKYSKSPADVRNVLTELKQIPVLELTDRITWKTLDLIERHHFSYWDSMLIASALENNCEILYTEDLQNGQIIENRLKIVNPFIVKRKPKQ
ncbi:MAG TPA: DNA-binding protein [Lentisphaeria bacterium]|nr:MAG: hypothetical protein A2X45_05150 [Lentisphaerae bacterium GWF2_50_93]HCE42018.1 DNA-binding protein [Lentisphaeria bacterium]